MILRKPLFFSSILLLFQDRNLPFTNAVDEECPLSQAQNLACPKDPNGNPYKCRVGNKNFAELFPGVNPIYSCTIFGGDSSKTPYCDCNERLVSRGKSGVTGCRCNRRFSVCEDGTTCMNGAPCVRVGDQDKYVCGCPYAPGNNTWVGEHCEYTASDICDKTSYDVSHDGNWFCTNNGRCNNAIVDPREKCKCAEGYYGLHCELKEEHECEIICQNGGICTKGVKANPKTKKLHQMLNIPTGDDKGTDDLNDRAPGETIEQDTSSYCVCPEGFGGDTCQKEVDECKAFGCENGSTCRRNKDTKEYYCDCGTIDEKDQNGELVPYAGQSCEHAYTRMCPVPDGYDASRYFCTNNGKCPEDFHKPCICPSDYSGPRCEFKTKEAPKQCTLPCTNDGQCFFGSNPPNADPYNIDFTNPENSEMHCKCPTGFTGFLCEISAELCADGTHSCANGGSCVKDGEDWMCECSKALNKETPFRGEKCENPATSYCVGPGASLDWFCTNEGVCKDYVYNDQKSHPGCICKRGNSGDYCEFSKNIYTKQKHEGGIANKAFLGFTISLFSLVIIFLGFHFFRHGGVQSKEGHTPIGGPPEYDPDYDYGDDGAELDRDNSRQVRDGYVRDNTMVMPDGYEDGDDLHLEGMDHVIGMDHVYVN